MKIDYEKLKIDRCTISDLEEILNIQDEALSELSPCVLRENTHEMLSECLEPPHIALGVWHNSELVAFSILYFIENGDSEDLAHLLNDVNAQGLKAANYKLCIVKKEYRGNSLQYKMGEILQSLAIEKGVQIVCATVSPNNYLSIKNVEKLGFIYNRTLMLTKYGDGAERNLYYKLLRSDC